MAARSLPTLPTFSPGPLSSTQLTQLATYQQFWANPPSFRAEQHTAQSIPTGGTGTIVTCETLIHDSDTGLELVTPFSYVVPFAGIWDFDGAASVANNATGWRAPAIFQNGVMIVGSQPTYPPPAANFFAPTLAHGVPCNVGDVIALGMQHSAGVALSTIVASPQCSWFSGTLRSLQTP